MDTIWFYKSIENFTLGDAVDAFDNGFCCVAENGKIKYIVMRKED